MKLRDDYVGIFILLFYLLLSVFETFHNETLEGQAKGVDFNVWLLDAREGSI